MKKAMNKVINYIIFNKKKGDINYFLGILFVTVITIGVLAIANASGVGWAVTISSAIKTIIDKAIAAIASVTHFS